MHKKYHEKFKILGILAVTTQAREGIETYGIENRSTIGKAVTTQAREGIETYETYWGKYKFLSGNNSSPRGH